MDDTFLDQAERLFLDAATDPDLWIEAVEAVSAYAGASGANMVNVSARGPLLMPAGRVAEFADRYVSEGWHLNDPRYRGEPILKARGICVDQDIVSAEEMQRLPYYTDWLKPLGFGWFAGLKVESGEDIWCLTLHRSFAKGAFDANEQQRLLRLSAVMSRGATLASRLDFARLGGAVEASEALNCACLFVNRFGKIVRMNEKADRMAGHRFHIKDGRLRLPEVSTKALQRHIEATVWPDLPADSVALQPVILAQPGQRPLVFQAFRLRGLASSHFAPAAAMVTITDLASRQYPSAEHLRAVFHFSAAEARLALALLEHFSLVDAARALDVSHETLRSQLKGMLAKTETRNQAELIDLIRKLGAAG